MDSKRYVVLVHGTFASEAAWVTPDSKFSKGICDDPNDEIITFRWSGDNSDLARVNASLALKQLIKKAVPKGARLFLIGHSHGGNIIRYAASLLPAGRVQKCIYLGTPFIALRRRNLKIMRQAAKAAILPCVIAIAFCAVNLIGELRQLGVNPRGSAVGVGAAFVLANGAVITLIACLLLLAKLRSVRKSQHLSPRDRVMQPRPGARKEDWVLFVRKDEALGLLSTIDKATGALSGLVEHLTRVAAAVLRAMRFWLIPFVVGQSIFILLAAMKVPFAACMPFGMASVPYIVLILPIVVLIYAIIGASLIASILGPALGGTKYAYGWSDLRRYLIFDTRALRTLPEGEASATFQVDCRFQKTSARQYRHCMFYDDDAVISVVRDLLRGQYHIHPRGGASSDKVGYSKRIPRALSGATILGFIYGYIGAYFLYFTFSYLYIIAVMATGLPLI